jgi:uncharacterized protein YjaZ
MRCLVENTIEQYETLFSLEEGREDYFRYQMMKPFETMWRTINVPLKANTLYGYDVLMATDMLGYLDVRETDTGLKVLEKLKDIQAMQTAQHALDNCLHFLTFHSLEIAAEELKFGLYIADAEKLALQKGYCGFGGIPGFIQVTINPNSYNIPRLPAVIAHEFHHNIRFSYFDWDHGNVTVGDYLVIEGLAESFAKELYGDQLLGPWVTSCDEEDLAYSTEVIKEALHIKGFAEVSSYMFGDIIAKQQGYAPVGLTSFAGYAVGYHAVQSFMKRQGIRVAEASLIRSSDILNGCGLF